MSDRRDESLDALLATARWPETDAGARERLDAAWNELTRTRVWRWSVPVASAAAMVVIGVGVWVSVYRSQATAPVVARVEEVPTSEPVRPALMVGREVTIRDIALMRMADREAALSKRQQDEAPAATVRASENTPEQRPSRFTRMLQSPRTIVAYLEMVGNEKTRGEALAALHQVKDVPVDALFAHLQSPRVDLRLAAAEALGELDGPVITRRLIAMILADQNRREAYFALASSRGREAQEFVKQAAESDVLASWAKRQTAIR